MASRKRDVLCSFAHLVYVSAGQSAPLELFFDEKFTVYMYSTYTLLYSYGTTIRTGAVPAPDAAAHNRPWLLYARRFREILWDNAIRPHGARNARTTADERRQIYRRPAPESSATAAAAATVKCFAACRSELLLKNKFNTLAVEKFSFFLLLSTF